MEKGRKREGGEKREHNAKQSKFIPGILHLWVFSQWLSSAVLSSQRDLSDVHLYDPSQANWCQSESLLGRKPLSIPLSVTYCLSLWILVPSSSISVQAPEPPGPLAGIISYTHNYCFWIKNPPKTTFMVHFSDQNLSRICVACQCNPQASDVTSSVAHGFPYPAHIISLSNLSLDLLRARKL